jgi:hypothetical protein
MTRNGMRRRRRLYSSMNVKAKDLDEATACEINV